LIIVTHDRSVAKRARRIITLSDGQVTSDESNGRKVEAIEEMVYEVH
jgi:ABC-type lipoprotein export system ATPase subunit